MTILAECPTCRRKQSNRNRICPCGADLLRAKRSRRVRYWVDYRLPSGGQRRKPVGNLISKARDEAGRIRQKKIAGTLIDTPSKKKLTFNQLTDWYLALESVNSLSSYWLIKVSLKKFNSKFGKRVVDEIKPFQLENYQAKRLKAGKAPATIDHEVGKTKTMINKAYANDMISESAVIAFKKVSKTLKRGSDVRDRILSADEFRNIMRYLPVHIKPVVATAYFTGMRRGEILSLRWRDVDLDRRVIKLKAANTKDGESRSIPICDDLYAILEQMPRRTPNRFVFVYRGRSIADIRGGLKKACEKAGVVYGRYVEGGFVFHDLRHTFNTNMRKAGVAESVIMQITGHSTREMFDRYNTIDEEDGRQAIAQLQRFIACQKTKTT